MREDTRSPVWGGATVGLVVGLILGLFVGHTYWMTVLYAVLIGAAVGVAASVLSWLGRSLAKKQRSGDGVLDEERRGEQLRSAEGMLQNYRLVDVENDAEALQDCVGIVGWIEEDELWRARYDSLESFYRAHEEQRPQIRDYGAVEREIPSAHDGFSLEERAEVVGRRLAALRHSRQRGE